MTGEGRKKRGVPIWFWIVLVVLLVLAAAYGLWQLSRSRDFQLFGRLVSHVETSEKVVALTFDDGPTADYTPQVLDLLKAKGIHATFFVIGSELKEAPDLGRRIVAAGHELANHTFTHPDMTLASVESSAAEIEPTDALIRAAGQQGDILFRPPHGKKLFGLPLYLAQHDRTTVTWDIEPDSFDEVAVDPHRLAAYALDRAHPGAIILLHAMYKSRETSRQALPEIVDGLLAQGYRFVTVSELLKLGRG